MERQRPEASAETTVEEPAKETLTEAPGAAQPHIGLAVPALSTMWSENSFEKREVGGREEEVDGITKHRSRRKEAISAGCCKGRLQGHKGSQGIIVWRGPIRS